MGRAWRVVVAMVVLAGAALVGVTVVRGTPPPQGPRPQVLDKVVVLGDSYSAGNGAGAYDGGPCFRTPNSAGRRYAAAVRARVVDRSCSGAVVADLTTAHGSLPPQVEAVDHSADVVVLTIGGNDVGFGQIVLQCFVLDSGTAAGGCRDAVARAGAALPQVRRELATALTSIRSRMRPDAVLVLRSYPYLASSRPLVETGRYDADRAVRALGAAGTAMQRQVVAAVATSGPGRERTYLDDSAATVFAGHEPGAGAASYFVGLQTPGAQRAELFHPNPAGWSAWGDSLTAFLAERLRA